MVSISAQLSVDEKLGYIQGVLHSHAQMGLALSPEKCAAINEAADSCDTVAEIMDHMHKWEKESR